jgi:large subunit ribosomal protein L9
MQVILREDVSHLGEVGDVVNVKAGFARNFLLPRGLAVPASSRQMKQLEHEQRVIESRVSKDRGIAEDRARKLSNVELVIEKASGDNDRLFGSVTSMEIEALLRERGFDVDRRKIQLDENIKHLGDYEVDIKLHRDVKATIRVQVVPRPSDE